MVMVGFFMGFNGFCNRQEVVVTKEVEEEEEVVW